MLHINVANVTGINDPLKTEGQFCSDIIHCLTERWYYNVQINIQCKLVFEEKVEDTNDSVLTV